MNDSRLSFVTGLTGQGADEVLDMLGGTTVQICAGSGDLHCAASQSLCRQLMTLLARLFDRIELHGDETVTGVPGLPDPGVPFLPSLRQELPHLRPPVPRGDGTRTVRIGIGMNAGTCDLYLGSTAWSAQFSQTAPQAVEPTLNTLGALASGTLGAAEVFKFLFGARLAGAYQSQGYTLNLLNYSTATGEEVAIPDSLAIDAVLFGVGSIGMGFLQAATLFPTLSGRLTLVDNGKLDERNPVKYSLIDWEAGRAGYFKAPWAAHKVREATTGRLDARGVVATAAGFVAGLPYNYRLPLALSAVDMYEARWDIQDTLPGTIINAGIDGTLAEVSVHGFGEGPCLGCLVVNHELESWNAQQMASRIGLPAARVHELIQGNLGMERADIEQLMQGGCLPPELLQQLPSFEGQPLLSLWQRVAYAESPVHIGSGQHVNVSSAFVSAFAGVLLLAETVKRCIPNLRPWQVRNSYRQQLLGVPAQDLLQYERDITGNCLCHSAFRRQVYREKYGPSE